MLGPQELILVVLIVVMIFGAKRIPEIMGGLGQGIRSFKKAMDGDEPVHAPDPKPPVLTAEHERIGQGTPQGTPDPKPSEGG